MRAFVPPSGSISYLVFVSFFFSVYIYIYTNISVTKDLKPESKTGIRKQNKDTVISWIGRALKEACSNRGENFVETALQIVQQMLQQILH